jgi:hypothetical protein
VDLGYTPLANAYLDPGTPPEDERQFPLHARVCERCMLVQLDAVVPADAIFSEYAYLSSYSASWVEHARRYALASIERFGLTVDDLVVELASNDGYLLRHFVETGIPVLGVEPAANVAAIAEKVGVPTDVSFFGVETAQRLVADGRRANLLVANNVLAHVPDLNDFVGGMALILADHGVATVEFPHLLRLIEEVQFDTIYHEHFSYFSLLSAEAVLARHGLRAFDVELLPTHGGSLRLYVCRIDDGRPDEPGLQHVRGLEQRAGLDCLSAYEGYQSRVDEVRAMLRQFLADASAEGKCVVAYGAAAKGNTLLNYCDVRSGEIVFVADRNPLKQDHLLPGSRIPVRAPDAVADARPDYLLILPWNLADEIMEQMDHIRSWGGRFVVPVPRVRIL